MNMKVYTNIVSQKKGSAPIFKIRYSFGSCECSSVSFIEWGCRLRAGDAFVPTAALSYLHSILLHNSVSGSTLYLEEQT